MKSSFRETLKTICLSFVFLLPLATHAKPAGEIIFRHPTDYRELWIGNVNDEQSARPIFRLPHIITEFSIQKDGRYIVAVVKIVVDELDELANVYDVYLLDRKHPTAEAKKLTHGEYTQIIDADVSPSGDVVFANQSFVIFGKIRERGLYLISNHEIKNKKPTAKLLRKDSPYWIDWAPDGKKIAYSTDTGIFLFNTTTKEVSQITKDGDWPVFSPDSKYLAFLTKSDRHKIGIRPFVGPRHLRHIEHKEGFHIDSVTWSADGQYLVYTLFNREPAYTNFAVHIESGRTEQILETYSNGGLGMFEWATRAYAVQPEGLMATVWGKIKQEK